MTEENRLIALCKSAIEEIDLQLERKRGIAGVLSKMADRIATRRLAPSAWAEREQTSARDAAELAVEPVDGVSAVHGQPSARPWK